VSNWQSKMLGEVCTLQRGFDLPSAQRTHGKFPLITSSGSTDFHSEAKVHGPGVITGRSGSIGSVFFEEANFWPLNTTLYVKDFHGNDPRFVYYLLTFLDLKKFATGMGVPTLNRNLVHVERVAIPSNLPEQRRIVAVLDEAFEGLAIATANTEKNLKNAREIFESYLNSVLTDNGRSWPLKTLKQVSIDFGRGKSKHRPRNDPSLYGGPYPFIQTGDVRNCDHWIVDSTQNYSEAGLKQSKLWPRGTICITIAANIAETGILTFDACFPDSVIGVVVDESQTSNDFVEYILQSVKSHLKAKGKGSAQDNINLATFEDHFFPFPDLSEQRHIVGKLNELSEAVKGLESTFAQKLATIAELKQSVLQKAFTGELTKDFRPAGSCLGLRR
jgi:type I restriction enzyme, S subunit